MSLYNKYTTKSKEEKTLCNSYSQFYNTQKQIPYKTYIIKKKLYSMLSNIGFPLAFIWEKTKKQFGDCKIQNALIFTLIFISTISLPTFFINYSSFNLPFAMILSWTLMSVVNGLTAGMILASVNKN